jgi:hypothetical protein
MKKRIEDITGTRVTSKEEREAQRQQIYMKSDKKYSRHRNKWIKKNPEQEVK